MQAQLWDNIKEVSELNPIADTVWKQLNHFTYPCLLLDGNLGAGKTTFIKQMLIRQDNTAAVSSPSFGIVNEYTVNGKPVYHFDLYRIKYPSELEEIGFAEYLDSQNICLIEWPDAGLAYYRDKVLQLTITLTELGTRSISLKQITF